MLERWQGSVQRKERAGRSAQSLPNGEVVSRRIVDGRLEAASCIKSRQILPFVQP